MFGFGIDGKLHITHAKFFKLLHHTFGFVERHDVVFCAVKRPDGKAF